MDVFTQKKRSEVMSRIRGRGNKATEIALLKILRFNRIKGWRRHLDLPGRPDFVFKNKRVVIFIDGCFWHCCPRHFQYPKTNKIFWKNKLNSNKIRDKRINKQLGSMGWNVIRFWEHDLEHHTLKVVDKLMSILKEIPE
jgi:DNA mismatch endonuclease, patch repair protein